VRVTVKDLWSPDLNPPDTGLPPEHTEFSVFVQVTIGQPHVDGGETFEFTVRSPGSINEGFVSRTLVMKRFVWADVRGFVEHRVGIDSAHSDTWKQLIRRVSPFMGHSDSD
jgi:hypothetical protein